MQKPITTIVIACACALSAPAALAQDNAPPLARPDAGAVIREGDAQHLLSYLRESLRAAIEGREPPPAAELEKRGAEIADTLRRRGAELARGLLDEAERRAREALKEWESGREPQAQPRRPLPPGQQAI